MPSRARLELDEALKDIDEIVAAHRALTGGTPGRPQKRQGAAVTRGGVVMLAAAVEAFVEDLYDAAVDAIFAGRPQAQLGDLKARTSGNFRNATTFKIDALYFNVGMAWISETIRWQKFSNAAFLSSMNTLIRQRNAIAHGDRPRPAIRLRQLRAWRRMVANFAVRLERTVADEIAASTGTRPPW